MSRTLSGQKNFCGEAAGIETDGQASLALGNIYRDGPNGEIDMKQAVSWYEKGASQGKSRVHGDSWMPVFPGRRGSRPRLCKSI